MISDKHKLLVDQFMSLGKFNTDGFKDAIRAGCQDMTVRTMKKITTAPVAWDSLRDYLCDDSKYASGKSLLKLLQNYFNDPIKDKYGYDRWHEVACEAVLSCLHNYYKPESVTYGKAQKVVNIAMKHICCLDGAEPYYNKGYFEHCHVALDSFILEWIYRKANKKSFGKVKSIVRGNFEPWSNISKKEQVSKEGKIVFSYQEIQDIVRDVINCNGLTPFEAEFYVWHQMQQTMAAEALFDPETAGISLDEFKKKPLDQKFKILENLLQHIDYPYYIV